MLEKLETEKMHKAFINNYNKATFVCPECERSKTVSVSQYTDIQTAVTVRCRCSCGHTYKVLLERRKHFRKKVEFPGVFVSESKGRGFLTVTDLSRSGLKLKLESDEMFDKGEKLHLEFSLDDLQRSLVKREVIIRNVKGSRLGVEFTSTEHMDRLGPYLLYNF